MSNHPPFVIRRPDGFVGVEVDTCEQLTAAEARELAVQILVCARAAEEPGTRFEAPGWIVWERANDGGRPFIRAIDLSEQKAEQHVAYLKASARMQSPPQPEPDLLIEETRLDHLYAASLLEALVKRGKKRRSKP